MGEVVGIVRAQLHEGRFEEYKRLCDEILEIVRTKDTGTLQYEIYVNDDQSECIGLERYTDEQALIQHGEHIGHLMDSILATGSFSGYLLGDVSPQMEANLAGGPVRLFKPLTVL
jgi:quinol monooxygenase YgiN